MMNFKMVSGHLDQRKLILGFFWICWLAYFTTYLGRLNYSACLVEITGAEGWSKGQAGLIATAFFACYGIGQLVNGFVGDKLPPKIMVALGLGISGLVNLCFPMMSGPLMGMVFWGCNGFAQSMIWSPMVRLISEWLTGETRVKACVNINSTVPIGTLATYGMAAGLVYLGNWRLVFYTSGTVMLVVTAVWLLGIGSLEKKVIPGTDDNAQLQKKEIASGHGFDLKGLLNLLLGSAVPLCMLAVLMQGMLKDGVTTWIPTILKEKFNMAAAGAVLCTTVVPIVNLGGVYLAAWLNSRFFKNEVLGALVFFCCGILSLLGLILIPSGTALFTLLLLAMTTTFMMGVNSLLVGLVPPFFVNHGICSTVSGLLNSSAYVGCALSSYLNGALAEKFGWNFIMVCWLGYAVFGLLMCFSAFRCWKRFRQQNLT